MTANWPHEADRGLGALVPIRPSARLVLTTLAVIGAFVLGYTQRPSSRETARLRQEARAAAAQQRLLEAQVARQHASLMAARSDLESLGLQVEAIELQLDGVDFLSRQVRQELGLPQSEATWQGAEEGRGGRPSSPEVPAAERLDLVRRRLAAGLGELSGLLDQARSRGSGEGAGPAATASVWRPPANWPARGAVTSPFGWRVYRGVPGYHTGIDIALPYGTPVAATGDGLVVGSGWQRGFGWCVFVQHGAGYQTLFAHLSETSVRLGDVVAPGQLIGLSGSSGNSTGPHLHYEIWQDGRLLDPRPLMDGTG